MKKYFVSQLTIGEEFQDFFLLKSIEAKRGSSGKPYLDLLLGDCTGDISAKRWDVNDEEMRQSKQWQEGSIIKIRGEVSEWNGMRQLKVSRIRMSSAGDGLSITDFVKAAPEDPNVMFDFIHGKAEELTDKDLSALCLKYLDGNKERLLYYPAASRNHHAEVAGLLWHIKRMLMSGERLCEVYNNLDANLVIAGVILHDMQKLNEIQSNEMAISNGYSFEGNMLGHLVMGVRELEKDMIELGFGDEKRIMIEHMILAHHYEPEFGSPIKPLFPEAELLHYLDIIDARMYDMEDALMKTKPGNFSDKLWSMDKRRIYKRAED